MAALAEVRSYPMLTTLLRVNTQAPRGELIGLAPRDIPRAYGPDNPLPMRAKEAPRAGQEAHRIWEKGMFGKEPTLPTDRKATVSELIRNSFAFVQVYGRKAGVDQVATISQGLGWDRCSPMEDPAEEMINYIAGREAEIVQFGQYKFVAFVRGNQNPEDVMARFIDAPRDAYNRWFPLFADAQNEIQNKRQVDILGTNGTSRDFMRVFNREKKGIDRAYKDNGKLSFQWAYEKHGNQLWGIDLDNMPISMTTLALDSPDKETKEMLLAIQKFLLADSTEDVWAIEFDFSETVSCCNISFNAQQKIVDSDYYDPAEIGSLSTYQKVVIAPTFRVLAEMSKRVCKECGEKLDGEHACETKKTHKKFVAPKGK